MNFTIVILSYNHPQVTERAVRSVLQFHHNVILVHNGSLSQHVEFLKHKFPEMTHLEIAKNRGYSGGANFALKKTLAKTEWVLFLTNDCELVRPVSPPATSGWHAPLIWRRKVGNVDSLGGVVDLRIGEALHLRSHEPCDLQSLRGRFYIPGSAFWIDRETWKKLGGFNESLGTYWEDIELSLRAPSLGVSLLQDANTQVLHRVGKTCHKDRHYTTYLYQRNRFIVSYQHSKQPRRFAIKYWSSMLRFSLRQILRAQIDHLPLIYRATSDGWRQRIPRPSSPDDRPDL